MQCNRILLQSIPLVFSVPELRKMNHGSRKYGGPTDVVKVVASYTHCRCNDVMNYNATHTEAMSQIQVYSQKHGTEIWQHCGQRIGN
jgi:hypothetical protein